MKRFNQSTLALTVLSVSALGFGAAGCNSSSAPAQAAPQEQTGPAWSLQYKATCAQGSEAQDCVGAYGLQINADGTFVVGPGPQGQTTKGKLDAEDFTALTQAAAGVIDGSSAANALSQESCN